MAWLCFEMLCDTAESKWSSDRPEGFCFETLLTQPELEATFLAACVDLIATGHGVEGTVLGVIFIIGLVAVIAFGRRR